MSAAAAGPAPSGAAPVPPRRWLLRLVVSFVFTQGAVNMARPAVSYQALELGAGARAVGVITAVFALLPLVVAVPLGRHTDRRRCGPLLPAGAALIAAGCALAGTASSLLLLAVWSAVLGLGHLVFMIGAQSLVARQSGTGEHDRNFAYFTIGGSTGQLIGPVLSGLIVGGAVTGDAAAGAHGAGEHSSAVALFASGALSLCSYAALWRIEGSTSRTTADAGEAGGNGGAGGTGGSGGEKPGGAPEPPVPVVGILRSRGVPAGIFASLAVLSTTDVLTAYLPVVGEERGIAPGMVGLLLSLRAAASVLSRVALSAMTSWLGRQRLLVLSCLLAGGLSAVLAVPVPVWGLALALVLLGFFLGVGQPLTMSTVVQAAPERARSTALALRITGNRLGQVAAPAGAGLLAGAAGAAAPFVLLGAVLVGASGTAARSYARTDGAQPEPGTREKPRSRVTHGTRRRTDTSN